MILSNFLNRIDHMAIAVLNLDSATDYYVSKMGFKLDVIRETQGRFTGMRSAVLFSGDFSVVLLQSTTTGSQIEKYINRYGAGVQHVAFQVDNIQETYEFLTESGVDFSTGIIQAPGLRQVFTSRDPNTGMMHEIIERTQQTNFDENNINSLFEQLEASDAF